MKHFLTSTLLCAASLAGAVELANVIPSPQQLHTLDLGIISLVCFGLNTYTDQEWGYGNVSPKVFNPTKFDAKQWVNAAKAAGIKRLVLVCKHHDGFCLWPSKLNQEYSVASTPWKDGKGDVVRELHDATLAAGLEFGAYLSPWDRHQADYARPPYVDYFHAQWDDLMDNYGPITEIWLDGANGGDGWYGGDSCKRILPKPASEYYEFNRLLDNLFAKNPNAVVFGPPCPRGFGWPGNESGFVPPEYRYTINGNYRPPECDTPFRKGWYWHKNDKAKSLKQLVDIYFTSVGRGGILDLGLAPNPDGLLDDGDVIRLKEFGDVVRAFNAVNFADHAKVAMVKTPEGTAYTYSLAAPATFSAVDFREDLTKGMRVRAWHLEANGQTIADGTLVGFRRMARFAPVTASEVKLIITACEGEPIISSFALRTAPVIQD